MRVSWNWLGDFIDLSGLDPQQVADKLTMTGMEVEGVEVIGGELDGVVLARVVECSPHPDADNLSLTKVDTGGDELVQVVCGAPNVATGVYAPLATVGTTMPGDFKIKKAKIRGQASFGMLCSAKELQIAEDADGLMLFDAPDRPLGTPIADVLGLRDTVLDISLTPNRPDGLSIRGVAREIAALYGRELREVPTRGSNGHAAAAVPRVADMIEVHIDDPAGCPRYAAAAVRDIRIGPAPEWMRRRLLSVGQRPVNNIVDVTNYVLFEQGQPLHAFDLERVRGGRIVVRRAVAGETIESIDHLERSLLADDLLICDAEGPLAIAGVMGGAESEIGDDTTDVLIECANFDPGTVRRTARRLGMHTESSHRFERGVDVTRIDDVMRRTIDLIVATQEELGHQCEVVAGTVDTYPVPYEAPTVLLPVTMPSRILGIDVSAESVRQSLATLGIQARVDGDVIVAHIPAYRPDLERPIDLVEEVGRLIGYDNLPSTPMPGELGLSHERRDDSPPRPQEAQPVRAFAEIERWDSLRDALCAAGMHEAVTWSFGDPARMAMFAPEEGALRLRNPLGEERSEMRRSLLPGVLDAVRHNIAHGAESVAIYEIGRVYPAAEVAEENVEPVRLTGAFAGTGESHWSGASRAVDGHDVVGALLSALGAVGLAADVVAAEPPPWAHPGVSAAVKIGRRVVGWVGRLHPAVLDEWSIEVPVYGFDLEIGGALGAEPEPPHYAPIARTPRSERDLALVVDRATPYSEIRAALRGFDHKLLESISLFDVYAGTGLPEGKKSVALRAVYRDATGTLTDEQVDQVQAKLLRHLSRAVGAELRS